MRLHFEVIIQGHVHNSYTFNKFLKMGVDQRQLVSFDPQKP